MHGLPAMGGLYICEDVISLRYSTCRACCALHDTSVFHCVSYGACAGMHALAESGEAAHTAYKGGLRPQQARRLRFWAQHSLELRSADRAGGWTSSEAAARELFR